MSFPNYGGGYGGPPQPPGGHYPPHTQPLLQPIPQQPQLAPFPGYATNTVPSSHISYGYPPQQSHSYGGYTSPQPQVPPPQQYSGYGPPIPQGEYTSPPGHSPAGPSQPPLSYPAIPGPGSLPLPPPTGRRKALLIGINYFGQRGQLRGCINDVRNMSAYLVTHFGYKRDDMVILTDDQQNPISQPTKQNILRAMHWLVKDARPNDSLFFHYSGHGGQTKDMEGDEPEGYDEVIYPVDFRHTGHIADDEMHRIMVQPLQAGVRLTAIFDSCHSGTALDLPYIYSTQGIIKQPNLAREAGMGILGAVSSYNQNDLSGVADHFTSIFKNATAGEKVHNVTKTSSADVVMFSGSRSDQTSADTMVSTQSTDAMVSTQATGAMSWAFISALNKNPQQSYVQLLNSIRDELASRYTQKPQLSCSHPLNTDLLFVM